MSCSVVSPSARKQPQHRRDDSGQGGALGCGRAGLVLEREGEYMRSDAHWPAGKELACVQESAHSSFPGMLRKQRNEKCGDTEQSQWSCGDAGQIGTAISFLPRLSQPPPPGCLKHPLRTKQVRTNAAALTLTTLFLRREKEFLWQTALLQKYRGFKPCKQ